MKKGNSKRSQKSKSIKELFALIAEESQKVRKPSGEGWKNVAEMAEEADVSPTTARTHANTGVDMGLFEKVKCGAAYWYRQI